MALAYAYLISSYYSISDLFAMRSSLSCIFGGFTAIALLNHAPACAQQLLTPLESFDALTGKSPCKVLFFKESASVCGTLIQRDSLTSWSMLPDNREGCSAIGICYYRNILFNIGYREGDAKSAILLRFVNQKTSDKFFQVLSNWEAGKL